MIFEERVKNLEPFGQITFLQCRLSEGTKWYCFIELLMATEGVDFKVRSDTFDDIGSALLDLENKLHFVSNKLARLPKE